MDRASVYSETGRCRVLDLCTPGPGFVDLSEVCDRVAWDEEARVVLVFLGAESEDRLSGTRHSPVERIAGLRQPVLAAIQGDAGDFTLELALACDIRIGTEKARFGFPGIRHGRIPSNGGTQRLPRVVGPGRALEMILTGELIDAEEALRIGLIHRVVAPELLVSTAAKMADTMAAQSPLSLSYAKEAVYEGRDLTLEQGIRMELDLYLHLFSTSDRTEGIAAFREKRKPEFQGN